MTAIECKILTAESEVEALAENWRQLYARVSRSPFTDYDYFAIWWRNVGKADGKRLHVVAGWEGERLVAVLPLTVARRAGLRIMQAAGYRAYNYADMLAENSGHASALWQAARKSPHYDFADIRDVYPETQCHEALTAFASRRDEDRAYFIRLSWKTGEDWKNSLPKSQRSNFKRCVRRLEEMGALQYETYKDGNVPEAIIAGMIEQKIEWSAANNMPGLFGHANVRDYYKQVLEHTAKQGTLFLAWLNCGGKVIAYNQGFIHNNLIHMPFWTYDPAFSKYSPGTVILVNTVVTAIEKGINGIDLRQGESQIKRLHANEIRTCAEFTFNGSLRGLIVEMAYMATRSSLRVARRYKTKFLKADSRKED